MATEPPKQGILEETKIQGIELQLQGMTLADKPFSSPKVVTHESSHEFSAMVEQ